MCKNKYTLRSNLLNSSKMNTMIVKVDRYYTVSTTFGIETMKLPKQKFYTGNDSIINDDLRCKN